MPRTWTQRGAHGAMLVAGASLAAAIATSIGAVAGERQSGELTFANPAGVLGTLVTSTRFDGSNPFFEDLGTNGRSCATCHRASQAWTIAPAEIRERFERTSGLDPLFRTNDGSNCEGADVSTLERRAGAFSLLLSKGLIRIAADVPANAEFEIVDVDDPYGCGFRPPSASLYRRPLPATNLGFLSSVMWDGRASRPGRSIEEDLIAQALDATVRHAEGAPPSPALLRDIVDFELGLVTAQARDHGAGSLGAGGAAGGATSLVRQPFCMGINDPLGINALTSAGCPPGAGGFDPVVFTLFGAWQNAASPERQAVARGEALFNTRRFAIDNVPGLNGAPGDPVDGVIRGTCTLCHNTPNAGNHSVALALNIGVADAARRTPDLPLYTLRSTITGELVRTTDPGRALVTGKWRDISKFKGPVLRGLAARAPYFHDGSAAGLAEVIAFYDTRFRIQLTDREKADLAAFLRAL